ncbi:MAG TPA: VOC family protein [Dermatophilaceae bacterium]|nr:VOC family protein [Dermatophilaceae bacterium]
MSLAMYSEVCLDASDPAVVGDFWARLLGMRQDWKADGSQVLTGTPAQAPIRIQPAPPGRMTEYRIHIEVGESALASMLDLGARVLDAESYPWTVVQGPEETELGVYTRDTTGPAPPRVELLINSPDPRRIADWWSRILSAPVEVTTAGDYAWVTGIPDSPFESLVFTRLDAPRTADPRLRLGVRTHDLTRLTDAGARIVGTVLGDAYRYVLLDPDGHEFYATIEDTGATAGTTSPR